ncbi:MAG: glycosyltransferase family 2 protein [Candidatus Marinimicrobia bacterium]|nr:glycosyltransferase family 2 protein [Candidatus Neomarinimicrobiota bacterium]MDD5583271.1 glycosyltransferase family 2 protein [Candidatus Neomarinimicrobiota bacterium]
MSQGYILIPAYQAEKTLSDLLSRIQGCSILHIVVVDDGSTDNTAQIAQEAGVHLLQHKENLGKGRALQTGFRYIMEAGGAFVITVDADLQHPPDAIPGLVNKYLQNPGTFIIGERERDKHMPIHRRWSNAITSYLVGKRIKMKIPDVQCGFRLIPGECLYELVEGNKGFVFETEMVIRLADKHIPLDFYPIPTIYMKDGRSSIAHVRDTFRFIKMYTYSFLRRPD